MVNYFSHYGVLGSPISHSLSPLLYRSAFAELRLRSEFQAIEVDAEHLSSYITDCNESWGGFAVTMPNKIAALTFAEQKSASAQFIGAANTLWKNDQGMWCAENTDVDGILAAFKFVGLPKCVTQQTLLILGAGGTARAVIYAARDYASEVIIAVRNVARAQELGQLAMQLGMQSTIIELNRENLQYWCPRVAMVISTLPQGIADNFTAEISLTARIFDVLYHPWPTPLMQFSLEHANKRVVGGVTMLLHQAFSQFRFLIGQEPPREIMAQALARKLGIPVQDFLSESI